MSIEVTTDDLVEAMRRSAEYERDHVGAPGSPVRVRASVTLAILDERAALVRRVRELEAKLASDVNGPCVCGHRPRSHWAWSDDEPDDLQGCEIADCNCEAYFDASWRGAAKERDMRAAVKKPEGDVSDNRVERCEVCDWPLAGSIEQGCTAGNCSYRPPEGSEEYRRHKKRRAELAAIAQADRERAAKSTHAPLAVALPTDERLEWLRDVAHDERTDDEPNPWRDRPQQIAPGADVSAPYTLDTYGAGVTQHATLADACAAMEALGSRRDLVRVSGDGAEHDGERWHDGLTDDERCMIWAAYDRGRAARPVTP